MNPLNVVLIILEFGISAFVVSYIIYFNIRHKKAKNKPPLDKLVYEEIYKSGNYSDYFFGRVHIFYEDETKDWEYCSAFIALGTEKFTLHLLKLDDSKKEIIAESLSFDFDAGSTIEEKVISNDSCWVSLDNDDVVVVLDFAENQAARSYAERIQKYVMDFAGSSVLQKKKLNNKIKQQKAERRDKQKRRREEGYDLSYERCHTSYDFDAFWKDLVSDDVFWGGDLSTAFTDYEAIVGKSIFRDQMEWGFNDSNVFVRMIEFFLKERKSENERINSRNWILIHNISYKNAYVDLEYNKARHLVLLKQFERKLHEDYSILMLPEYRFENVFLDIITE